MKLKLHENPKEWRKQVWLAAFGLALISSLLRWRRVLPVNYWLSIVAILVVVAICAWMRPRWFRGYYRFSMRVGFAMSQAIGFVALMIFFLLIITPLGMILRLSGKDLLQLKQDSGKTSYWLPARQDNALDRLF